MTHEAGPFRDTFTPDSTPAWDSPHGTGYRRLYPRRDTKPNPAAIAALAAQMTNSASPQKDSKIPAGFTYWGQFLAHDLTLAMPGASDTDTDTDVRNGHSGRLDLECLLGRGPRADPHLYSRVGAPTLVLEMRGNDVDVARRHDGMAVIADGRNDDNVLVGQVHIALAMAYNRLARAAFGDGTNRQDAYARARRELTVVYQHVTLNDYLPRVLHESTKARLVALTKRLLSGTSQSPLGHAALPVEFSFAAMRFGHSMARTEYSLNDHLAAPVPLFPRMSTSPDDSHLRGGSPLPVLWTVDWSYFFDDVEDANTSCQMSSPIDTSLTPKIGKVELNATTTVNLAMMTMTSEGAFGVPTAKQVLRAAPELGLPVPDDGDGSLWWSILREAEGSASDGLGPAGSSIVLEGFEEALAGVAWPASRGVTLLDTPIKSVSSLLRWGQQGLLRDGSGRASTPDGHTVGT